MTEVRETIRVNKTVGCQSCERPQPVRRTTMADSTGEHPRGRPGSGPRTPVGNPIRSCLAVIARTHLSLVHSNPLLQAYHLGISEFFKRVEEAYETPQICGNDAKLRGISTQSCVPFISRKLLFRKSSCRGATQVCAATLRVNCL